MKRTFYCSRCGEEFEIEADAFLPGVHGSLSQKDGPDYIIRDPTMGYMCDPCTYTSNRELLETQVIDPVQLAKEISENA